MQYEFIGYSVPGGVAFYGSEQARHARTVAKFKGGVPIKVIYKKVNKQRTPDQNSLYWVRNAELASETGYSKESLHEQFMVRAGYGKRVSFKTAEYFFRSSSRDLDIKQFSELMKYQDELALFLNEDREPDQMIRLTQGEL
jgi:hypothetical protein